MAGNTRRRFAGNLEMHNFGTELRVVARESGRTSRILTSRATLAYIYTQGLQILESGDILGIIDFWS